ncbi:MAG: hypothetical protein ACQETI_12110, partial [Halobacteriota archaeon]
MPGGPDHDTDRFVAQVDADRFSVVRERLLTQEESDHVLRFRRRFRCSLLHIDASRESLEAVTPTPSTRLVG